METIKKREYIRNSSSYCSAIKKNTEMEYLFHHRLTFHFCRKLTYSFKIFTVLWGWGVDKKLLILTIGLELIGVSIMLWSPKH
jgi:hypothetical protein